MAVSELIIYTRPTCLDCQELKAFLKAHKIPYQLKEVATNSPYEQELIALTGNRIVPVIQIKPKGLFKKTEVLIGFEINRTEIEKLLEIK